MGDGATIQKTPLFNILLNGVYNPTFVAQVYDCSEHLAKGLKKTVFLLLNFVTP